VSAAKAAKARIQNRRESALAGSGDFDLTRFRRFVFREIVATEGSPREARISQTSAQLYESVMAKIAPFFIQDNWPYTSSADTTTANGTPIASKCFWPQRTLSASLVRSFR
jgi:hypothetical protein